MKKNILLIMCDQLSSRWLGYAGNSLVQTPNIDRLAGQGVSFPKAVCNSPVCAPSRISLAGGLYPHHLGSLDNFSVYPIGRQPTYYQKLRAHGYRVGVVGKTDLHKADHFCGPDGKTPVMYDLGFTDPVDTEGKMHAMKTLDFRWNPSLPKGDERVPLGPYQVYLMGKKRMDDFAQDYYHRLRTHPDWYAGPSVLPEEDYHDSYIAKRSVDFLKEKTGTEPWHLFVSFVGPHDPWDAPQRYYERYKDVVFPAPPEDDMSGKPAWITKRSKKQTGEMTPQELLEVQRQYAGMITHIDDKVGEIISALEQTGQRENTLIVFCADHGEQMGSHGLFHKRVMYEGALRIPMIICDPNGEHGVTSEAKAELVDLYATFLEYAGIPCGDMQLDSKSLMPVVRGETQEHKRYQFSEICHGRMITDRRYKYIENINDKNELYDLEHDPQEIKNIIAEEKELAHEMQWKMNKIMAQPGLVNRMQ